MELKFQVEPHQLSDPRVQKIISDLSDLLSLTKNKQQQVQKKNQFMANIISLFDNCSLRKESGVITCSNNMKHSCPLSTTSGAIVGRCVNDIAILFGKKEKANDISFDDFRSCFMDVSLSEDLYKEDFDDLKDLFRRSFSDTTSYHDTLKNILEIISNCDIFPVNGVASCLDKGHVVCPFREGFVFTCRDTYKCFQQIANIYLSNMSIEKYELSLAGYDQSTKDVLIEIYNMMTHNMNDICSIADALSHCNISMLQDQFMCTFYHKCPLNGGENSKESNLIKSILRHLESVIKGGKVFSDMSDFKQVLYKRFPYLNCIDANLLADKVGRLVIKGGENVCGANPHPIKNEPCSEPQSQQPAVTNDFIEFLKLVNTGFKLGLEAQKQLPKVINGLAEVASGALKAVENDIVAGRTCNTKKESEIVHDLVNKHYDCEKK